MAYFTLWNALPATFSAVCKVIATTSSYTNSSPSGRGSNCELAGNAQSFSPWHLHRVPSYRRPHRVAPHRRPHRVAPHRRPHRVAPHRRPHRVSLDHRRDPKPPSPHRVNWHHQTHLRMLFVERGGPDQVTGQNSHYIPSGLTFQFLGEFWGQVNCHLDFGEFTVCYPLTHGGSRPNFRL